MKLLSTKILNREQQLRFTQASFELTMYEALTITARKFDIPEGDYAAIFTSQNAAQAYLDNGGDLHRREVFCVGEKAALLLSQNGQKVIEIGQNSLELGQKIVKTNKNRSFLYFSGNLRRPELPNLFNENNIAFNELVAYDTRINFRDFTADLDAVLFFSPSGVSSYFVDNKISNPLAICIGETTATAARAFTKNIKVAIHTTVDGVIDAALKTQLSL